MPADAMHLFEVCEENTRSPKMISLKRLHDKAYLLHIASCSVHLAARGGDYNGS